MNRRGFLRALLGGAAAVAASPAATLEAVTKAVTSPAYGHSLLVAQFRRDFFDTIAVFRNFKDTEGAPVWDGPFEDAGVRFGSVGGNLIGDREAIG